MPPQKGAARLVRTIWTELRMATSVNTIMPLFCKANWTAGTSCESMPATSWQADKLLRLRLNEKQCEKKQGHRGSSRDSRENLQEMNASTASFMHFFSLWYWNSSLAPTFFVHWVTCSCEVLKDSSRGFQPQGTHGPKESCHAISSISYLKILKPWRFWHSTVWLLFEKHNQFCIYVISASSMFKFPPQIIANRSCLLPLLQDKIILLRSLIIFEQ